MGWSEDSAREVIRVSFGPCTNEAEIDALLHHWRTLFEKRRAA
jgi:cysteine desulfurase